MPTQPARITSGNSMPPRPWNTAMRPAVSSISARVSTAEPSALSRRTFGWRRLSRSSPALDRPTPMYCGAFWIATGSGEASATAPKKSTSSSSVLTGLAAVWGGCRITQSAPCSAAARTKAICSAGVAPNTVIASGRRPLRSSATQAMTARRSSGVSLLTSVPRPSAAMPWAPSRRNARPARASPRDRGRPLRRRRRRASGRRRGSRSRRHRHALEQPDPPPS